MDLSRESTREGVRGGREQFRWDSLKSQPHRDRQQYLGYSTKVGTVGKFGQYHTNDWWRKGSQLPDEQDHVREEKFDVERMRDDMLMRAIGTRPRASVSLTNPEESTSVQSVKKEEVHPADTVKLRPGFITARDEDEDVIASRQVSGLGFRQHLKPADWSQEAVDVEEFLAPSNEFVDTKPPVKQEIKREEPRRTFGPARPEPVVKQETRDAGQRSPYRERHGRRSRSRDDRRRRSFSRDRNYRRRSRSRDRYSRRDRH